MTCCASVVHLWLFLDDAVRDYQRGIRIGNVAKAFDFVFMDQRGSRYEDLTVHFFTDVPGRG